MRGRQSDAGEFKRAAAAAIVELLSGKDPVKPCSLALSGAVCAAAPDDVEDKAAWLERQWGWLALTWWCRFGLSDGQRDTLLGQHYDLSDLGTDFFRYLTRNTGANGVAVRPPAAFILASACPPAVLKEWFGRFLVSSDGPFEKTVRWKLKRRFDDALKSDSRFVEVSGSWALVLHDGALAQSRSLPGETIAEHLARTVGPLKPFLYGKRRTEDTQPEDAKPTATDDGSPDKGDREDPIIRRQDALKVAQAAIAFAGPIGSWELALACHELLPPGLWCEIMHLETQEDASGNDDGEKDPRAGTQYGGDMASVSRANPDWFETTANGASGDTALSARHAWQSLSPKSQIVAAARLFRKPPWAFREIEAWTCSCLRPEYHIKLQRAHDRAGKDDSRIMTEVAVAVPLSLREAGDDGAAEAFLGFMADDARKMLLSPPSHWVSDQLQERRPPAHE